MSIEFALLVASLGAVGALVRYALLSLAHTPRGQVAALAVVNIAGSAIAGVLVAAGETPFGAAALVGLCGGLTTFSALALQLAPGGQARPVGQILGLGFLHGAGSALAAWAAFSGATALGFPGWG